jgi:hypothetical protein
MGEKEAYKPEISSRSEKLAPSTGELRRIETFEIERENFGDDGETFYLGPEARITIQRSQDSPTGLEVYSPFAEEKNTPLKPGLNTVGRRETSDVVINVATVSRDHLSITVDLERVYVTDIDTTNGTRVEL